MRNRASAPPRDETAFINGGTAGTDKPVKAPEKTRLVSKAKPVSVSLFEDNLKDIDDIIREEMVSGSARVNRSDVMRAAVDALKKLTKSEISTLIQETKQRQ